jgi:hypothetical protein
MSELYTKQETIKKIIERTIRNSTRVEQTNGMDFCEWHHFDEHNNIELHKK